MARWWNRCNIFGIGGIRSWGKSLANIPGRVVAMLDAFHSGVGASTGKAAGKTAGAQPQTPINSLHFRLHCACDTYTQPVRSDGVLERRGNIWQRLRGVRLGDL